MPTTGTIWLEGATMQEVATNLQTHLNKFPHLDVISVSHTVLPNNRFSAFVALRNTRANVTSGLSDNNEIIPPVE